MYRLFGVLAFLVFALVLSVGKGPGNTGVAAEAADLPAVESCAELTRMLEEHRRSGALFGTAKLAEEALGNADRVRSTAPAGTEGGADYSATNVQVGGVDEADIVKTDGEYIYQVNRDRVLVIRAYPAPQMSVVKAIEFGDERFSPRELYLNDEYLVVVGTTYRDTPYGGSRRPWPEQSATVRAIVFDIRDTRVRQFRAVF